MRSTACDNTPQLSRALCDCGPAALGAIHRRRAAIAAVESMLCGYQLQNHASFRCLQYSKFSTGAQHHSNTSREPVLYQLQPAGCSVSPRGVVDIITTLEAEHSLPREI